MTALLTVAETAQRLRVSEFMVRHLEWTGKITSTRIGSRVLIAEADLDAFMTACRAGGSATSKSTWL